MRQLPLAFLLLPPLFLPPRDLLPQDLHLHPEVPDQWFQLVPKGPPIFRLPYPPPRLPEARCSSQRAPGSIPGGPRQSLFSVSEERSEEHTSELQSRPHLVCRLL